AYVDLAGQLSQVESRVRMPAPRNPVRFPEQRFQVGERLPCLRHDIARVQRAVPYDTCGARDEEDARGAFAQHGRARERRLRAILRWVVVGADLARILDESGRLAARQEIDDQRAAIRGSKGTCSRDIGGDIAAGGDDRAAPRAVELPVALQ